MLRSNFIVFTLAIVLIGCASKHDAPPLVDNPNVRPDSGTLPPLRDSGMPAVVCDDAAACAVVLTAAASAIPADGVATDAITATVNARLGGSVEFKITGVGTWKENDQLDASAAGKQTLTVAVDADGKAKATLLSDAGGGTATISAQHSSQASIAQLTIDMPALADIKVTPQYPIMGVKSSGFQETNTLTFDVLAANGAYPAGLKVTFAHNPIGGSTIGIQPTCTTPGCTVTDTGFTDDKGKVKLSLASGTKAGTAIVTISATAGGQTKTVQASSPIVGAKASGSNIAMNCSPRNVPALVDTDCIHSRIDAPVRCTMTLGDRFSNQLGIATDVTFASEAGIAGPPQPTDPKTGAAIGTIATLGGALPLDVPPNIDEPFSDIFIDDCHQTGPLATHNPRDGIVSVIAMVKGEEGFVDQNGDGNYNLGEAFIDLSEPFVDANDNGVQDPGEFFLDVNNNMKWDGPNGVWDSTTTLWTETRITYSGPGAVPNVGVENELSRFGYGYAPPGPPAFGPSAPMADICLTTMGGTIVPVWFSDENFNVLAPDTVKYTADVLPSGIVTVSIPPTTQVVPVRASEGFFFKQEYCDADDPSMCKMTCPPSASTKRCVLKSSVILFDYGAGGGVQVIASTTPGGFGMTVTATVTTVSRTKFIAIGLGGSVVLPGQPCP